jgi:hypothetical protein
VEIARYTLTGNLDGNAGTDLLASAASKFVLVNDAPDLAGNHNGGTVRFGVDGALWASLGEDANPCAAQAPATLRGVILRLRTDLLPPGAGSAFHAQLTVPDSPFATSPDSNLRLVAAYGLRNPFRFQIDPAWGTLAIGDVGDFQREELDLLQPVVPVPLRLSTPGSHEPPGGASELGANFGWPWREGLAEGRFGEDCGPEPPGLVPPVWEYDRSTQFGGAAIISAGFYRPQPGGEHNWPESHDGDLFANDYYTGDLRRLTEANGVWTLAPSIAGQPSVTAWGKGFGQVSDWRVGADGALWFLRQSVEFAGGTGTIGRIRGPDPLSVPPRRPLSLRLARSPALAVAELWVVATADARIRIVDASGRVVRTLEVSGPSAPGAEPMELRVTWDGYSEAGELARPGMYLALVESGGRRAALRVPFLR